MKDSTNADARLVRSDRNSRKLVVKGAIVPRKGAYLKEARAAR